MANKNYGIVAGVNLPGLIVMSASQDIDDGSMSIEEIIKQAKVECNNGVVVSSYSSLNVETDDDEL